MFCPQAAATLERNGSHRAGCGVHPSRLKEVYEGRGGQGDCKRKVPVVAQQKGTRREDPDPLWPPRGLGEDNAANYPTFRTEDMSSRNVPRVSVSMNWMEQEVVSRLLRLDEKVENLKRQLNAGLAETVIEAMTAVVNGADSQNNGDSTNLSLRLPVVESQWRRKIATNCSSISTGCLGDQECGGHILHLPQGDMLEVDGLEPSVRVQETVEKSPSTPNDSIFEDTACMNKGKGLHPMQDGGSPGSGAAKAMHIMGCFPEVFQRRSSLADSICSAESPAPLTGRALWYTQVWQFLDNPESGTAAMWYASAMPSFLLGTVFFSLIQTVEPPLFEELSTDVIDTIIEIIFSLEFFTRLVVCPNRCSFICDWYNLIDLVSILPFFLRSAVGFKTEGIRARGNKEDIRRDLLLAFVPVLRLMKSMRWFERLPLLTSAIGLCCEALPICLFSLLLLTLVFSALIFLVEPRDNIGSVPQAMWLTIVTMTTVGYGDTTPTSAAGSCIVAALVISSVLYMAMPLGMIGQAFQQVWGERDRVLLIRRTKDRLRQWGYRASQIPVLFATFDVDGDGSLDLTEFIGMITEMRIGLSHKRVLQLFESFDSDGSGNVDASEFIKALFPGSYSKIYGVIQGNRRVSDGERGDVEAGKDARHAEGGPGST